MRGTRCIYVALMTLVGCSESSKHDACERLLLCAAQTQPGTVTALLQSYGPEGTCHQADPKGEICNEVCRTELKKMGHVVGYDGACAECEADDHCDAPLPACDPYHGRCVQCTADSHCDGLTQKYTETLPGMTNALLGVCDSSRSICVECRGDSHCKDPSRPHCDATIGLCISCNSDAQCPADKPRCLDLPGAIRRCAECKTSADCPTGKPACDVTTGTCGGCNSFFDCPEGNQCIDGHCKQTCASVLSCIQKECQSGCDPNQQCGLLTCPAAVDLAKCVAAACPDCFKSGFYSYSCDQCITAACGSKRASCSSNNSGC